MKKPETLLLQRVCNYIRTTYPMIPYHVDFSADVRLPMGVAKQRKALQGRWSKGHPDLVIYTPTGALFLELKATKTVQKSKHTDIQKAYHQILRNLGYTVAFCCGYEEAIAYIETALKE